MENTVFSVKSVLLDISKSRGFFKPGLPYDLEVFLTNMQGCNQEILRVFAMLCIIVCHCCRFLHIDLAVHLWKG